MIYHNMKHQLLMRHF